MKVLLTGIGGSIGVHTFKKIMEDTTWDVIGIDSFRHKGLTDRLTTVLEGNPEWKKRLYLYTHDLTAPISPLLKRKIGYLDYIISMASLSDVDASIEDPAPFILNNVQITTNLLELARDLPDGPAFKLRAFIQISTDEVYGPSGPNQGHPEWSSILPSNPYSASKAAQEAIAISYWRTYGVPLIITNTMNNFGEMQQPSKFPAMVQRKIAEGKKVTIHGKEGDVGSRYYIHSEDFADALLFLMQAGRPYMHKPGAIDRPDRYNIVGERRIDNLELAQLIASLMDKELKYEFVDFHKSRPGHDKHYGLDGTKLTELGWSPSNFEQSLKRTIEWQQNSYDWRQE